MAIVQEQRQAIESIRDRGVAPPRDITERGLLLEREGLLLPLSIGGISVGAGMNSQVRDMDVLVMTFAPASPNGNGEHLNAVHIPDPEETEYMVLNRPLSQEEHQAAVARRGMRGLSLSGVVVLRPVGEMNGDYVLAEVPDIVDYVAV